MKTSRIESVQEREKSTFQMSEGRKSRIELRTSIRFSRVILTTRPSRIPPRPSCPSEGSSRSGGWTTGASLPNERRNPPLPPRSGEGSEPPIGSRFWKKKATRQREKERACPPKTSGRSQSSPDGSFEDVPSPRPHCEFLLPGFDPRLPPLPLSSPRWFLLSLSYALPARGCVWVSPLLSCGSLLGSRPSWDHPRRIDG